MLMRYTSEPELLLIIVVAFVVAITIHEFSHALVATWLGDDLPRLQGRVSLNPLRHLDPLGTLMIAIASFGWGRPVLVNPYRLRFGLHRGMALVALAGPVSNLLLAVVLTPLVRQLVESADANPLAVQGVFLILQLNVFLAVFNLIPIPPLDGFSVVVGLAPTAMADRLNELRRYGPVALLAVFLLISVFPAASGIIARPANFLTGLLLGP